MWPPPAVRHSWAAWAACCLLCSTVAGVEVSRSLLGLGCGAAADPAVALLPFCLQLLMRRCAGRRSGMRGVPCPSRWSLPAPAPPTPGAGFTPQYTEMAELQNKYNKQGLEVLAFPCNQVRGELGAGGQRSSARGGQRLSAHVQSPLPGCVAVGQRMGQVAVIGCMPLTLPVGAWTVPAWAPTGPPPHLPPSCAQFGAQEPGSNSEIKSFAERKGFKGPMVRVGQRWWDAARWLQEPAPMQLSLAGPPSCLSSWPSLHRLHKCLPVS